MGEQGMGGADQYKEMQMAMRQQEMMMKAQEHVRKVIEGYYADPGAFSDSETLEIKQMAQQAGVGFEPEPSTRRAVANGVFNALDTASLGLLPDSWGPAKLTTRDEVGSMIGGLAGFAIPGAIGMKAGKMAVGAAEGMAAGKGISAFKGASQAAAGFLQPEASFLMKSIVKMRPGKAKDAAVKALEALYGASTNEKAKKIAEMLLRYKVPGTNFGALRAGVTGATALGVNDFFGEGAPEPQY